MTFAENIVAVWERATPSERAEGMAWYDDAHALALDLSPGDVWRGAGVIASYSPIVQWPRTVILASDSLRSGVARTDYLPVMVAQAQRILDGEPALSVLNGPKVRAFASAIADPAGSEIATIDRHAHDIAVGRVFSERERNITKRKFRIMSEHYRQASFEVGVSVAQIQAVTWVRWRNEKRSP